MVITSPEEYSEFIWIEQWFHLGYFIYKVVQQLLSFFYKGFLEVAHSLFVRNRRDEHSWPSLHHYIPKGEEGWISSADLEWPFFVFATHFVFHVFVYFVFYLGFTYHYFYFIIVEHLLMFYMFMGKVFLIVMLWLKVWLLIVFHHTLVSWCMHLIIIYIIYTKIYINFILNNIKIEYYKIL